MRTNYLKFHFRFNHPEFPPQSLVNGVISIQPFTDTTLQLIEPVDSENYICYSFLITNLYKLQCVPSVD